MGTKVSPLSSLFDRVSVFSVEMFAFHADVPIAYDRAALIELVTLSARAHAGLEESGVRCQWRKVTRENLSPVPGWTIQAYTYQNQAPTGSHFLGG